MIKRLKKSIQPSAIKQGFDYLPYGIAFARINGIVILCNHAMHAISYELSGETLLNANSFWDIVTQSESLENGYLLSLSNDEKWLLHRSSVILDGQTIYEFYANNVTRQYRLTEELRAENIRLSHFSDRMRQFNKNALDLTARKELLERKAHTHDKLGHLLHATRAFLFNGNTNEEALWHRWHINACLMLEETRLSADTDLMKSLHEMAESIGVKIIVSGVLPDDTEIAELFFAACGESLTNLLRHANGTELYALIETTDTACKITLTNNGIPPSGKIVEGGGLSALRHRVENAGGCMMIRSIPEYKLIMTLTQRRNAYYDPYIDR